MNDNWQKEQPPWIVFPGMEPVDLRATQGVEEVWVTEKWWPFWMALSEIDKKSYLQSWQCTDEWRDWIEFYTRQRKNYDEAEDIEDRKRFLAEQKNQNTQKISTKISWISRLFSR